MNTPYSQHLVLKGSHKPAPDGTPVTGIQKTELCNVTLRLRPGQPLPNLLDPEVRRHFSPLSRSEFALQYATVKEDLTVISDFAHHEGFSLIRVEPHKRSIEIRGTVTQMENTFKVSLSNYKDHEGKIFRGRTGDISIPVELEGIVEGVFGLDTRAVATPKIKRRKGSKSSAAIDYYPTDVAKLYNFPPGSTGKNQCIGIIELGGGYNVSDITAFFKSLGLASPTLVPVAVDGGSNDPGKTVSDSDGEVTLDIEVAGSIAPDARIAVYFAGNTSKSFQDAVNTAIHDTTNKPSIISISWGGPEDPTDSSYYSTFDQDFQSAAAMGITVCAAAGDSGSTDGVTDGNVHVDYPSSSPYVLGCGGTTLKANLTKETISSEVVWNEPDSGATGGGISDIFPVPTYQATVKMPLSPNTQKAGRGVPDVAGDADPDTGYKILLGGKTEPIGGTSAVAPLMAGLLARINEQLSKPAGFINPVLYANPSVCRDITQGNNDTLGSGTSKFMAGTGWDPCSGNGVPDGAKLLQLLKG